MGHRPPLWYAVLLVGLLSVSSSSVLSADDSPSPFVLPETVKSWLANGSAQTYDANGNLTSDGTATYTYDAENRLTQVVKGSTTTTFTYDAFGQRYTKTVNGITTKFFYDGDQLVAETDASGGPTGRYLYGPGLDGPLEMKRA